MKLLLDVSSGYIGDVTGLQMVTTDDFQQKGHRFYISTGAFLCGVCKLSLCVHDFFTPVTSLCPTCMPSLLAMLNCPLREGERFSRLPKRSPVMDCQPVQEPNGEMGSLPFFSLNGTELMWWIVIKLSDIKHTLLNFLFSIKDPQSYIMIKSSLNTRTNLLPYYFYRKILPD